MSILKSTHTGRCSIRVNLEYLLAHGWKHQVVGFTGEIDYDHIIKNNHCLKVINLDLWASDENFRIPTFHEEIGDYVYNQPLFTLDQLDIVEEFWRIWDEVDFETAEKYLLEKFPYVKSRNALKDIYDSFTADISSSINKKIVDRIMKIK